MAELPPGFRFYPTEEELVCFYLRSKLDGRRSDIERVIPVADVCAHDPWQLPGKHLNLDAMVQIADHRVFH
jgi:hypothetical protein